MNRDETVREVTAGLTTFLAMSYIVFTNPIILQPMGMAPGAVAVATCFTASIACALSWQRLNLPSALACGMGLNVFTAAYHQKHHTEWPNLLIICGIVSIIVLIMSNSKYPVRRQIIDALPPQIFSAIKAGVGAILTGAAFNEIANFVKETSPKWGVDYAALWGMGLFFVGLVVILVVKHFHARSTILGRRSKQPERFTDGFNAAAFLISILVLLVPAWYAGGPSMVPGDVLWVWAQPNLPTVSADSMNSAFSYGLAVLFIMTLDIAGSPIDYFKQPYVESNLTKKQKEDKINSSLLIDSGINILVPAFGVTPVVYYFENHAGWQAGGRTGIVPLIVSVGFLTFGCAGIACIILHVPITQWVPRISVMPTLFFVGLMLIADSFVLPAEAEPTQAAPLIDLPAPTTPENLSPRVAWDLGRTLYFIPGAITTVVASITFSLDTAMAAGILSYAAISTFPEEYLGIRKKDSVPLFIIYLASAIVLVLSLWNIDWSAIAKQI